MGSPASELNQDSKPQQTYSMLLKSFGDQPDQHQKLEEFLAHLEEEWLKIEAFKRELPLCMQLLANAMEASRQQLQSYKQQENHEPKPILEEFIPLKHSIDSEGSQKASNISEKSSWMVSAQLWSQPNNELTTKQQTTVMTTSTNKETEQQIISYGITSPNLSLDEKKRNGGGAGGGGGGGGAFLPFTKERNTCSSPTLLALASTEKDIDEKKCLDSDINNHNNMMMSCNTRQMSSSKLQGGGEMMEQGKGGGGGGGGGGGVLVAAGSNHHQQQQVDQTQGTTAGNSPSSQTHRKARRCWSPDLHRRFVNALQMLGGSQVATPKQIRELMKVDGLTNDEVKSHLQKYRLHTRRPSPSPQAGGAPTPQLVVLGSIWVPPEYATAAAAAAAAAAHNGGGPTAIYGAHPGTLTTTHYCAPPVPQDFYPAPPQPHHQFHHHHVYKISSQTHSSPESDIRGAGDRSESIEDGKSDSSSWKGDSGENGGERRGLASLRDEGDKSNNNGSEITLKF